MDPRYTVIKELLCILGNRGQILTKIAWTVQLIPPSADSRRVIVSCKLKYVHRGC